MIIAHPHHVRLAAHHGEILEAAEAEAGLMGEDGEEGDDRDLDKEAGTFTSLLRLDVCT